MVNPLSGFSAFANPFGSEIDLRWEYPSELPQNYKLYIFQRAGTDVDQVEDIDRYFTNIADLTGYEYNKLFVHDDLPPEHTSLGIYQVKNDLKYYFKAVIRDEDTGEYSEAVPQNATPSFDVLVNIVDGKDIVVQATKKMLDSLTSKEGKKLSLSKEIVVEKSFTIGEINGDKIIVERVNGSNNQRFWADLITKHETGIIEGDFDIDVIKFTYLTIAGNSRRDGVANILRSRKIFFRKMLKKLGAEDIAITIEGDYYRPDLHGENCLGFNVIFSLLIQTLNLIEQEKIDTHTVNEMKVQT